MNHVELTRRVLAHASAFELDALAPLIHEDIVLEIPFPADNIPPLFRGKETFMAGMGFLGQLLKEFELTPTEIYDCPGSDTVAFEMVSRGVLMNGAPYQNDYFMTFTFRDGKVWRWREGFDPQRRRADIATLYAR